MVPCYCRSRDQRKGKTHGDMKSNSGNRSAWGGSKIFLKIAGHGHHRVKLKVISIEREHLGLELKLAPDSEEAVGVIS
jgi:hypothetical protein